MAMTPARVVLTYRDYAALPNDGRRYEIHEGELSVTPAPGRRHQEINGNLFAILREHVVRRGLGRLYFPPTDVILSDTTIVQPDLVFVANDRAGTLTPPGVEGPPTLVVEILSPSTIALDRHTKLQLYARYRIPWYWIVDPDARALEVYRLEGARYALASRHAGDEAFAAEPFADLTLTPSALWA